MHVITAAAHKEAAKLAILKRLREAGATTPAMPASAEIDGEDAKGALAELRAAGTVREARPGLYYVDDSAKKAAGPGNGFVALLAILIILSVTASVIAIVTAG